MKNLSITLEETIPHYDSNGVLMQMVNFRFAVSGTQEEGQTEEQLREEIEKEFIKSREYCSNLTPIVEQKQKRFNNIIKDLTEQKPELKQTIQNLLSKYK